MRIMVTASIIAISSALSANAATIFAGPGPISITDADVALGIAIDGFDFVMPGSVSWTFTNNSSTELNFFGALANGLSINANAANAIASLSSVTVGFITPTEAFDTPFDQNAPSYSGSVAL